MSAPPALAGALGERVGWLARRYDLAPAFVAAYLDARPHVRAPVEAARDEDDLYARLGPRLAMYVRFALTTTERGRAFLGLLPEAARSPRRFLDVGCAYGGFLRAARATGAEVVGVEIDPALAALARANLDGGAGAVLEADALALSPREAGRFDLVACNDVVEHVASAGALVRVVADLLAPGGLAYFEIPNPHALDFVARDGHFQLFGLTLVDHDDAARAVEAMLGKPYAGMGALHEEAAYLRWFADSGLVAVPVAQRHAQPWAEAHRHLFDVVNAYTWWRDHDRARLPAEVAGRLDDSYWPFLARAVADCARARAGDGQQAFVRRYLTPFWTFLLRRPG